MIFGSIRGFILAFLSGLCVVGCSDGRDSVVENIVVANPPVAVATKIRSLIAEQGLTGDALGGRTLPSIGDPVAQLGMKLFFSKSLSGQTDTACVSCHHPMMGGGDNLSLPIGVDAQIPELLGTGRRHSSAGFDYDGGPTVPRNAPTTFNIGLWDEVLFHDGRVESIGKEPLLNGEDGAGIRTPDSPFASADSNAVNLTQGQALFPITSAEEMRASFGDGTNNQEVRDALAARLVDQTLPNTWLAEFQSAFNSTATAEDLITFQTISHALGEYERSQVFVDSPWKAFVEGDDGAISESAQRGAELFYSSSEEGGADCAACHSGDFFTDEKFHVVATPQIGRGKGDGEAGDDDFGRFRETRELADMYAFRTPTLLNVAVTGPWTHAGAYTDLAQMIRHHLEPAETLDEYDFTLAALDPGIQGDNAQANTQLALMTLQALQASGGSKLPTLDLTDTDVEHLLAFMHALTDTCVEDRGCMGQWIPDNTDGGPDALQLNAVDANNELL
jgi:cytochrome c peroxidase